MNGLLRTKSIDSLIAAAEQPEKRLNKTLGPWSLTAFGIGAVIGSGIFILTGTAAAGETVEVRSILKAQVWDLLLHGSHAVSTIGRPGAGPGISLSFLLTALVCGFAALCYAELASMIPVAGSAYTYAYATMGEIFAWIIGWDLILEYAVIATWPSRWDSPPISTMCSTMYSTCTCRTRLRSPSSRRVTGTPEAGSISRRS